MTQLRARSVLVGHGQHKCVRFCQISAAVTYVVRNRWELGRNRANEAQEADIRAVMLNEKDLRQTRSIELIRSFPKFPK